MKTTLIFAESGDTYLAVEYKPGEITRKQVKPRSILNYAQISGSDLKGYSVRFQISFFRRFDRDRFISRQGAVMYEQTVFDKYFDEFIKTEPSELYENETA